MTASPVRIAIMCSFNLDLIKQPLLDELGRRGLDGSLYVSGYGQWETDALNRQSDLYKFDPEIVCLFAETSDLLPTLRAGDMLWQTNDAEQAGAAAWTRIQTVIQRLTEDAGRAVLVHTLVPQPCTALGTLEGNDGFSYVAAAEAFNRRLRDRSGEQSRLIVFDYHRLLTDHGWRQWHDERLWYLGRMRLARGALGHLAAAYARYVAALRTPRRKCLVLDLDNTLWGGIIGEDGIEGIEIGHEGVGLAYREFQLAAMALSQRGIILAVCSKNNPADAAEALESHPEMVLRPVNFATMQIGWDPKPVSIRCIAEELNIGLDSLVFWDDDPREREIVRAAIPDVLVPEVPDETAHRAARLLELECFDVVRLTDEDRRRGEMYRQQRSRQKSLAETTPEDLETYYHSLETKAVLRQADDLSLRRIAQLTQRTNQFNCTTRRYSEADVRSMLENPAWAVYGLSVSDRFGDLGLVGAAILQLSENSWELDTLLLSCRALGRGIEDALLATLNDKAQSAGVCLQGAFIPTKKNSPARKFLDRLGIELRPSDDSQVLRFCLGKKGVSVPPWIELMEEEADG